MPWRHRLCGLSSKMGFLLSVLVANLMLTSNQTNALIITPSFDSSITTALNADAIESSILKVINTYDSLIADPIDVSIYFRRGPVEAGFASQSASTRYAIPYGAYTESLALNAALFGNPVLTTAVATLTTGNKSDLVGATSASLRALLIAHGAHFPGLLGTDGELGHGTFDGVIFLSPSETVFQYSRPVPPHRIDAMWAIAHEINEVLGVGGIGSILLDLRPPPGNIIFQMDPYRYAAPGVPSLTENSDATAFFSIDGGQTALARFNQDHTLDYGDWNIDLSCQSPVLLVQAAAFCPGYAVDMTRDSPEAVALQAIGYDLQSVPEPTTGLILLAGLSGLGLLIAGRS